MVMVVDTFQSTEIIFFTDSDTRGLGPFLRHRNGSLARVISDIRRQKPV